VFKLVLPADTGRCSGLDGFKGGLELGLESDQVLPVLWQIGGRQVAAIRKAFEMFGARVDRKGIQAMSVRSGMESVGFGAQVFIRGGVALGRLDTLERIDDRAASLAPLDEPCNGTGLLAKHDLDVLRECDLIEIFDEATMVILVTLRNAAPVEAFRDDRVGHAQPEQLGVLKMT
jgi:hypothetical protein